jgi:hypothetical protein
MIASSEEGSGIASPSSSSPSRCNASASAAILRASSRVVPAVRIPEDRETTTQIDRNQTQSHASIARLQLYSPFVLMLVPNRGGNAVTGGAGRRGDGDKMRATKTRSFLYQRLLAPPI